MVAEFFVRSTIVYYSTARRALLVFNCFCMIAFIVITASSGSTMSMYTRQLDAARFVAEKGRTFVLDCNDTTTEISNIMAQNNFMRFHGHAWRHFSVAVDEPWRQKIEFQKHYDSDSGKLVSVDYYVLIPFDFTTTLLDQVPAASICRKVSLYAACEWTDTIANASFSYSRGSVDPAILISACGFDAPPYAVTMALHNGLEEHYAKNLEGYMTQLSHLSNQVNVTNVVVTYDAGSLEIAQARVEGKKGTINNARIASYILLAAFVVVMFFFT
eukprot:PhM_4_TR13752/c0_g1_i1/m.36518